MFIKQLSVFIENREGRLEDIFKILDENDISVYSFSLADTSEYGILRLLVSNVPIAQDILKKNGFSASITDVIAIKAKKGLVCLHDVFKVISGKFNIEYMYVSSTAKDNESIIIKTNDNQKVFELLEKENFILNQ